jgi:predicted amidohydrolase
MIDVKAAVAQFEARDGDKDYNLGCIAELAREAAGRGAALVCFHELCVTGYTFLENLTREEITALAEPYPEGRSIRALTDLAASLGIAIAAGIVERGRGELYNCHVVVTGDGPIARHRKIHEFISPHLSCGSEYNLFDYAGARWGMLTCYDNNLPENARITAMLGADIILAPHVTGCLPSPAPGRGIVEPEVWHNRHRDPVRCRMEFDGPKGRGWITKWLPARAWENGLYILYANVLGIDGGSVKPGGSMMIDPYGEILAECRSLEDEVVTATLAAEARRLASGESYIRARRTDLYGKLAEPNPALAKSRQPEVYWKKIRERDRTPPASRPPHALGSDWRDN